MTEPKLKGNYVLSSFDEGENTFYLKPQNSDEDKIAVVSTISLKGLSNGDAKVVNTTIPLGNYSCCRLLNPYLTAQGDVFKVKIKIGGNDKTVGYIFSSSSLIGDEEDVEENFDEAKQAYKFYCLKYLIQEYFWDQSHEGQSINTSNILNPDAAYIIIYTPLLADENFSLSDLYPSLALNGYFNFPETTKPNILNLLSFTDNKEELDEIVKKRFLSLRGQQNILLKNSRSVISQNSLINLLYSRLLVEADNPLYRFLLLYQIIEYLVDKSFRDGLDNVIKQKANTSNYKFLQQINNLSNTRSTINSLFDDTTFDEKSEITGILKDFILEFDSEYDKQNSGDCLYDIRNILLHDYKSVLAKNRDGSLVGLEIQCEILIHRLVIGLGDKFNQIPIVEGSEFLGGA